MKSSFYILSAAVVFCAAGCGGLPANQLSLFTPSVSKEGVPSFTFTTYEKLVSSYPKDADPRLAHEALISLELGRRQYCMKGYDITSVEPYAEIYLKYTGVCKF